MISININNQIFVFSPYKKLHFPLAFLTDNLAGDKNCRLKILQGLKMLTKDFTDHVNFLL